MASGQTFSIEFVSMDKKRKTGGTMKYFRECVIPVKQTQTAPSIKGTTNKVQNHYKNATRSFHVLQNGEKVAVKKLHIFLITRFNNKKVVL